MFKRNKYIQLNVLLLLLLGIFELSTSKITLVQWAHTHQTLILDYIFFMCTKLGETPLIAGSLLTIYFLKREWFWWAVITVLFNTIMVQSLKFGIDAPRPCWELGDLYHSTLNIKKLVSHSFPSGHTAAAILSLGLLYSLFDCKNVLLFFVIAISIAYSRMYLGLHYSIDLLAGAFIGIFNYILFLYLTQRAGK